MGYLRYKFFSQRTEPFTFKHRSGMNFVIPSRMMQTYKECFFDETYTKGLPEAIKKRLLSRVVDIGANVGYFSLFTLAQNAKADVFAYEPMPNNFKLLNQYKDQFAQHNFNTFNMAVSGSRGTLSLNYNKAEEYTTSATLFNNANEPDSLKVETITLDDVLAENQLETIDFLKLDCEGAEYAILYNAQDDTLARIHTLSIETHQGPQENENLIALCSFLEENGFQVKAEKDQIWAWR
jgi:FkbM family methyltransferase